MASQKSIEEANTDNLPADALLRAAHRCRQLFRDIRDAYEQDESVIDRVTQLSRNHSSSQQPRLTLDDLVDDFEQFRVWSRNLGVFAPDQTSLDYRLREAQDVKSGLVSLLKSLEDDLDALSFLIHNDREIETPEDCDSSDSTDSSSEESDFHDAFSRTAYELHARLQRIAGTINKLMQIAEVIRASNPGARAARSANYVHYENGTNVTEQFEKEYLPLVLEHRFKLKTPLIPRFVKAISSRRRRFLYQAKHQQRLAYPGEYDDPLSRNVSSNTRRIIPTSLPIGQPKSMHIAGSHRGLGESNILTVATSFNKLKPRKTAPSTIVSASTKGTSANLEIPPPPVIQERATHFQCPYCCLLLQKRKFLVGRGNATFSTSLWNRHVLADLQPFVCVEDNCPTPNLQLETREEWLNHQKWEHSMEWWCEGGDVDHEPIKFDVADNYIEHMERKHHCTSQSANKQASAVGGPSFLPFNACPFCDFDASTAPEAKKQEQTGLLNSLSGSLELQEILQKHICDELVNIFLIALPERDDIRDVDTETGRPVARGSTVRALDDVVLSYQENENYQHTRTGSNEFPLEFTLSNDPYETRMKGPEIWNWDDVWDSPQLQECVRSTYTGFENDPHLQEMLAAGIKEEMEDRLVEKWIPTLSVQDEGDEEPLVLIVGRRVPDDVKGYGIRLEDVSDVDYVDDSDVFSVLRSEVESTGPSRYSVSSSLTEDQTNEELKQLYDERDKQERVID